MYETWHKHALTRAQALGLSYDGLKAAHDIISGALGAAWVERCEARLSRPHPTLANAHALDTAMRSSTDTSLIEVAEVARYLTELSGDSRISSSIERLRVPAEYGATLFELAMAYRWKNAGAIVTLEPDTPAGRRADFDAVIGDSRFVIECSTFPADVFSTPGMRLVQMVLNALPAYPFSVRLEVEVDLVLPGNFEALVRTAIQTAKRDFETKGCAASIATEFGSVVLRRTDSVKFDPLDPLADDRWTFACRQSIKQRGSDGSSYGVHLQPDLREGGWVMMRYPEKKSEPYEALARKFKREYEQLRGVTEPRIVLLDATAFNANALSFDMEQLNNSVGQAILDKPKVSMLGILSRTWTSRSRFQYRGPTIFNPNCASPLPTAFFDTLGQREHWLDFLTNRTFAFDVDGR